MNPSFSVHTVSVLYQPLTLKNHLCSNMLAARTPWDTFLEKAILECSEAIATGVARCGSR